MVMVTPAMVYDTGHLLWAWFSVRHLTCPVLLNSHKSHLKYYCSHLTYENLKFREVK